MTYQTYEFTVFTEQDLLDAGAAGSSVNCGDTFVMSGNATTCISVTDNDGFLSGDHYCDENANDHHGQHATITDAVSGDELGNGRQIYGESYFWVHDQNGKWYLMIEIEQEGTDDSYYAFHNYYGVPAEGATLTIYSQCNITDWEPDYKCLTAGPKLEPGSIGGRVFDDADCDNTERNAETGMKEAGIENVTVELLDEHGNVVATDITDANGKYLFEGLEPNAEYVVRFVKPSDLDFVKEDVGSGRFDSDANVNTGESFTIHLSSGEKVRNVDAGLKSSTGTIEGRVWCDLDCDGIEDKGVTTVTKGENLLSDSDFENGATHYNIGSYGAWYDAGTGSIDIVQGTAQGHCGNAADNEIVELDKGGIWCQIFDVTQGGKYCLTFDVYDNKCLEKWDDKFIVKINGQDVETVMVTQDGHVELLLDLEAGQNRIDFVSLSTVSGRGPGIDNIEIRQEIVTTTEAEPGKEGVVVNLIDANGTVIATTETDADGNYKFAGVASGDYTVEFETPAGQEFTLQNQGTDETMDSDADPTTGRVSVTVKGGEVTGDVDAGLKEVKLGSLSGRYFCDDNGDGLDNDGTDNGIGNIQVELLDAAGNGLGVFATTDPVTGAYSFGDLAPGIYGVRFTDPTNATDGKALTIQNANGNGNDDIDSDASGDADTSQILGIEVVADQNTPNNDAGVVPLGSIAGRYFCDTDGDDVDNGNGNEPGINGLTVILVDTDTGQTVATQQTSNIGGVDGSYLFDDLAAGNYQVIFPADPDGKAFVAPNDPDGNGDDTNDSDAVPNSDGTASSQVIPLGVGENVTDIDAGVVELGSIAGRYFCDENDNDIDDAEPGINGLTVTLVDTDTGQTVATQQTSNIGGVDGSYFFGDLTAGNYQVVFPADPTGKTFVAPNDPNGNGNDTNDSDAVPNSDGTASSQVIALGVGENVMDIDAGVEDPNGDPTPVNDQAAVCADDTATIDLLSNDSDPDGNTISITEIKDADETAGVGGSITLESGGTVTLNADGTVTFNPGTAYDGLEIRDSVMDQFQYTVTDSNGGSAMGTADVKVCGALNTIETIAEGFTDANGDPLQASYRVDQDVDVDFSTSPPTFNVDFPVTVIDPAPLDARLEAILGADGTELFDDDHAYCVDQDGLLDFGVDVLSNLHIVGSDAMNTGNAAIADAVVNEENLDIVTWIMNQGFQSINAGALDDGDLSDGFEPGEDAGRNYSFNEVQDAIWFFTDGSAVDPGTEFGANSQEIIDLATTAGEGFVAGEGDKVAVLFDPIEEDRQTYMIAVDFDVLKEDCVCDF